MKLKVLVWSMSLSFIFIFFVDYYLCRKMIFLPAANLYIKQINLQDGNKKILFSLRLLPLLADSNKLDYVILKGNTATTEEIFIQNDSLIIFPVECCNQLDGPPERFHFITYNESYFTIKRFSAWESAWWEITNSNGTAETVLKWGSRVNPQRFYNGNNIKKEYSYVSYYIGWRGEHLSGGPNEQKVHLWSLLRKPRKFNAM